MSKQTVDLLEAFDALPIDDKQAFAVEILRRTCELPFDSGPIADDDEGLQSDRGNRSDQDTLPRSQPGVCRELAEPVSYDLPLRATAEFHTRQTESSRAFSYSIGTVD